MKKILILAAAALFAAACGSPKGEKADDGQQLFIGDDIAVAQTQYGKVRGYILHDIYQFKGIPVGGYTQCLQLWRVRASGSRLSTRAGVCGLPRGCLEL